MGGSADVNGIYQKDSNIRKYKVLVNSQKIINKIKDKSRSASKIMENNSSTNKSLSKMCPNTIKYTVSFLEMPEAINFSLTNKEMRAATLSQTNKMYEREAKRLYKANDSLHR